MRRVAFAAFGLFAAVPSGAAETVFDGGGAVTEPAIVFEGGGEPLVVPVDRLREVAPHSTDSGYALVFRLGEEDSAGFADLTARLVGQVLAVSVCGIELARPVVRERIDGGRGIVPVPDAETAVALTEALRGEAPCPTPAE